MPDDWEDYEDTDDEFADDDLDCGLMPNGQCMHAGTEHCDWDCGKLNAARIAEMKAKP